jgi:hypothetical protein
LNTSDVLSFQRQEISGLQIVGIQNIVQRHAFTSVFTSVVESKEMNDTTLGVGMQRGRKTPITVEFNFGGRRGCGGEMIWQVPADVVQPCFGKSLGRGVKKGGEGFEQQVVHGRAGAGGCAKKRGFLRVREELM